MKIQHLLDDDSGLWILTSRTPAEIRDEADSRMDRGDMMPVAQTEKTKPFPSQISWWKAAFRTMTCRTFHRAHWEYGVPIYRRSERLNHYAKFLPATCRQCCCLHVEVIKIRASCLICHEATVPGEVWCESCGNRWTRGYGSLDRLVNLTLSNRVRWINDIDEMFRLAQNRPAGQHYISVWTARYRGIHLELRHREDGLLTFNHVQPNHGAQYTTEMLSQLFDAILWKTGIALTLEGLVETPDICNINPPHHEHH